MPKNDKILTMTDGFLPSINPSNPSTTNGATSSHSVAVPSYSSSSALRQNQDQHQDQHQEPRQGSRSSARIAHTVLLGLSVAAVSACEPSIASLTSNNNNSGNNSSNNNNGNNNNAVVNPTLKASLALDNSGVSGSQALGALIASTDTTPITNSQQPSFTIVTDPGNTVQLLNASGVVIGQANDVNNDGKVSLQPTVAIAATSGTLVNLSVRAISKDSAGNPFTSQILSRLSYTFDQTAPTAATLAPSDALLAESRSQTENGLVVLSTKTTRPSFEATTNGLREGALLFLNGVLVDVSTASTVAMTTSLLSPSFALMEERYVAEILTADTAGNSAYSDQKVVFEVLATPPMLRDILPITHPQSTATSLAAGSVIRLHFDQAISVAQSGVVVEVVPPVDATATPHTLGDSPQFTANMNTLNITLGNGSSYTAGDTLRIVNNALVGDSNLRNAQNELATYNSQLEGMVLALVPNGIAPARVVFDRIEQELSGQNFFSTPLASDTIVTSTSLSPGLSWLRATSGNLIGVQSDARSADTHQIIWNAEITRTAHMVSVTQNLTEAYVGTLAWRFDTQTQHTTLTIGWSAPLSVVQTSSPRVSLEERTVYFDQTPIKTSVAYLFGTGASQAASTSDALQFTIKPAFNAHHGQGLPSTSSWTVGQPVISSTLSLRFEKFTLDNGATTNDLSLMVLIHGGGSQPIKTDPDAVATPSTFHAYVLWGSSAADELSASSSSRSGTIVGGPGDDMIKLRFGASYVEGGEGEDTFNFELASFATLPQSHRLASANDPAINFLADFESNGVDMIAFTLPNSLRANTPVLLPASSATKTTVLANSSTIGVYVLSTSQSDALFALSPSQTGTQRQQTLSTLLEGALSFGAQSQALVAVNFTSADRALLLHAYYLEASSQSDADHWIDIVGVVAGNVGVTDFLSGS